MGFTIVIKGAMEVESIDLFLLAVLSPPPRFGDARVLLVVAADLIDAPYSATSPSGIVLVGLNASSGSMSGA